MIFQKLLFNPFVAAFADYISSRDAEILAREYADYERASRPLKKCRTCGWSGRVNLVLCHRCPDKPQLEVLEI